MEPVHQAILDSLPKATYRSKLEPHRELIRQAAARGGHTARWRASSMNGSGCTLLRARSAPLSKSAQNIASGRNLNHHHLNLLQQILRSWSASLASFETCSAKFEAVSLRLPRERTADPNQQRRCTMTANGKRVVFTMGGKGGVGKPGSWLPWLSGLRRTNGRNSTARTYPSNRNRLLHLCFAAIRFAWSMTCCSFWSVSTLRPQLAR